MGGDTINFDCWAALKEKKRNNKHLCIYAQLCADELYTELTVYIQAAESKHSFVYLISPFVYYLCKDGDLK